MSRDVTEITVRLDKLEQALGQLQQRVDRMVAPIGDSHPPDAAEGREAKARAQGLPPGSLGFAGRTLVVMGGAFLLRAITEAGVVPPMLGSLLGMAYAALWLVQADRSVRNGQRLSAGFHALASVVIAYPLILEATTTLGILSATGALAAVAFFLALGLVVAARNDLAVTAWMVTIAAVITPIALGIRTENILVFTIVLLLTAAGVEILAFTERWLGLRWLPAFAVDLAIVVLAITTLDPESQGTGLAPIRPEAAILAVLALPLIYLSSVGARTLLRSRQITHFEVVQAAIALLLGFGSALRLSELTEIGPAPIGLASLALGGICYATAFAFVERKLGRGRNFYAYTTYALFLVLAGSWLLLDTTPLVLAWSALAITVAVMGGRWQRITLKFHCAAYLIAAAVSSGLVVYAFDGLLADPRTTWDPLTVEGMVVAGAIGCCYAILVAMAVPASDERDRLPEAAVAALLAWIAAGMAAAALVGPLGASDSPEASRAFVAAGRTGVLAVLAVTFAWAGRRWSLSELVWLVYPIMAIGAAKLLWEDIPEGEPLSMFIALALYGGALYLNPRLMRVDKPGGG